MRKSIYISLLLIGHVVAANEISLHNDQTEYLAGELIELIYCTDNIQDNVQATLQVTHSLGSQLMVGQVVSEHVIFNLPEVISKVAGYVSAKLYLSGKVAYSHSFEIKPNTSHPGNIESFCGPKHLVVDRRDYTMITSTVLDAFDNPYLEGTKVQFSLQSGAGIKKRIAPSRRLYAFQRFYAPYKKGYGTVTASHEGLNDKAFRLVYYTHDPVSFGIRFTRQHQFADGEQLVSLTTTKIQDRLGNIIGNGTLVAFSILHSDGHITEVYANTKDGVATAVVQAPSIKDRWKITAEIDNYANSRYPVYTTFKASVQDIPLDIKQDTLTVGPVLGFMGQFVKNQTPVRINADGFEQIIYLHDGSAQLSVADLPSGSELSVVVCGITRKIKIQ